MCNESTHASVLFIAGRLTLWDSCLLYMFIFASGIGAKNTFCQEIDELGSYQKLSRQSGLAAADQCFILSVKQVRENATEQGAIGVYCAPLCD